MDNFLIFMILSAVMVAVAIAIEAYWKAAYIHYLTWRIARLERLMAAARADIRTMPREHPLASPAQVSIYESTLHGEILMMKCAHAAAVTKLERLQ